MKTHLVKMWHRWSALQPFTQVAAVVAVGAVGVLLCVERPLDVLLALVAMPLALAAYCLPILLAHGKRNFAAIAALNVLLGWTFVGWCAALVWSLTKDPAERAR